MDFSREIGVRLELQKRLNEWFAKNFQIGHD